MSLPNVASAPPPDPAHAGPATWCQGDLIPVGARTRAWLDKLPVTYAQMQQMCLVLCLVGCLSSASMWIAYFVLPTNPMSLATVPPPLIAASIPVVVALMIYVVRRKLHARVSWITRAVDPGERPDLSFRGPATIAKALYQLPDVPFEPHVVGAGLFVPLSTRVGLALLLLAYVMIGLEIVVLMTVWRWPWIDARMANQQLLLILPLLAWLYASIRPVYLRIDPGRLAIIHHPWFFNPRRIVEAVPLRSDRLYIDWVKRVVHVDDRGVTRSYYFGLHRQQAYLVERIVLAARSTTVPPVLPY